MLRVNNLINGVVFTAMVVFLSSTSFAAGDKKTEDIANKFSSANALFALRAESHKNVTQAKSLYKSVLESNHAMAEVKKMAFDRYARLAVFEGEINFEAFGVKHRDKIFSECIKMSKLVSPKKLGEETAEYTYWRAMCTGLWAANADAFDITINIGRIHEMSKLMDVGITKYRDFDFHGFNRMSAGIMVRGKSVPIVDLYHPEMAIKIIDAGISKGCSNYMDYVVKAEAELELNDKAAAKQTLEKGIAELREKMAAGAVPLLLVEENKIFLITMHRMLKTIS